MGCGQSQELLQEQTRLQERLAEEQKARQAAEAKLAEQEKNQKLLESQIQHEISEKNSAQLKLRQEEMQRKSAELKTNEAKSSRERLAADIAKEVEARKAAEAQLEYFKSTPIPPPNTTPKIRSGATAEPKWGTLKIEKIDCSGLAGVEIFGENDPYVVLQIGEVMKKTEVKDDAGAAVIFENLDISFDVTKGQVEHEVIDIKVWDKNQITVDVLIGESTTLLSNLEPHVGKLIEVEVDIFKTDLLGVRSKTGHVVLYSRLATSAAAPPPTIRLAQKKSDPFEGSLEVSRIECTDLKNVELLGKNDPYVVFKLGQPTPVTKRTPVLSGSGATATFENLSLAPEKIIKFDITDHVVRFQDLHIELWDDNKLRKDVLIGKTSTPILNLLAHVGQLLELSFDIFSEDHLPAATAPSKKQAPKKTGHVKLFITLNRKTALASTASLAVSTSAVSAAPEKLVLQPQQQQLFKAGILKITKISCSGLAGANFSGGILPFLNVELGEESVLVNSTNSVTSLTSGGPVFDHLALELSVTDQVLQFDEIIVKVHGPSSGGVDQLIGQTSTVLVSLLAHLGRPIELPLDIVDKTGRTVTGQVTLFVQLDATETRVTSPVKREAAFHGILHVTMIQCVDLPMAAEDETDNNKYDTFVKLELATDRLQTGSIETTGRVSDVIFDNLQTTMRVYVTDIILEQQPMAIKVYSTAKKGKIAQTPVLVGQKSAHLASLVQHAGDSFDTATTCDASLDIFDTQGKKKGRATVHMRLQRTQGPVDLYAHPKPPPRTASSKSPVAGIVPLAAAKAKAASSSTPVSVALGKAGLKPAAPKAPKPFSSGVLKIYRIECSHLENVEMMGKNDPFVKVTIAGESRTTVTMDNAGAAATFDDLDFVIPVDIDILRAEELLIEVSDSNDFRSNVLIGDARLSLTDLLDLSQLDPARLDRPGGKRVQFSVTLKNIKKHKGSDTVTGRVKLFMELEADSPVFDAESSEVDIAEAFVQGNLSFTRIQCSELKNVELLGRNDPYVVFKIADEVCRTATHDNAGASTVYEPSELKDIKLVVTEDLIHGHHLEIEVFDENDVRSHQLIGKAKLKVTNLLRRLSSAMDVAVDIFDASGKKKTGHVVITLRLDPTAPDEEEDESGHAIAPPKALNYAHFKSFSGHTGEVNTVVLLPKHDYEATNTASRSAGLLQRSSTTATVHESADFIRVTKVVCEKLKNVELLGKNDPYVSFQFGSATAKTDYVGNAGASAVFDKLNLKLHATEETLHTERLHVKVYDYNDIRTHQLIGQGSIALLNLVGHCGEVFTIKVNVFDAKGSKKTGELKVTLYLDMSRLIASGSDDGNIKVWDPVPDAVGHTITYTLQGHTSWVRALLPLPDATLVSGSGDTTIKIWDLSTAVDDDSASLPRSNSRKSFSLTEATNSAVLEVSSKVRKGNVVFKVVRSSKQLSGHTEAVNALLLLKNGHLASGSDDSDIRIWDMASARCLHVLSAHGQWVRSLVQLKNGDLLTGSFDAEENIHIWNTRTYEQKRSLVGHSSWVRCMLQLRDGLLATGSGDETIKIWEEATASCLKTLQGHTSNVCVLLQLTDGRLVSGSDDSSVKVWGVGTGTCHLTLRHSSSVHALLQLKDGRLATGAADNTVVIWDLDVESPTYGSKVLTLDSHQHSVYALLQLPDGRIVSGSADTTVTVWGN